MSALVFIDWFLPEFRERVSKRRNIVLTDRLSEAFRLAEIRVSQDEEAAEEEFLKDRPSSLATGSSFLSRDAAASLEKVRTTLYQAAAAYEIGVESFQAKWRDAFLRTMQDESMGTGMDDPLEASEGDKEGEDE